MVSVGLCCPCKYECVPNVKSQLEVRLGVVLAFRAPPYTHAHNLFIYFFNLVCPGHFGSVQAGQNLLECRDAKWCQMAKKDIGFKKKPL